MMTQQPHSSEHYCWQPCDLYGIDPELQYIQPHAQGKSISYEPGVWGWELWEWDDLEGPALAGHVVPRGVWGDSSWDPAWHPAWHSASQDQAEGATASGWI